MSADMPPPVSEAETSKPSTLQAILAYFKPKPLIMLALGFSSGLPYLLIFDTLSAWLRDAGIDLKTIGFFVLVTFSYSLKFMWAPLIDRLNLPILTAKFGHRRSWMLVTQGLIILGLWGIAGSDPKHHLVAMATMAALTGFFAASQDIVMDAWRIEAADGNLQGVMVAAYQWGFRLAMLVAGAVPLILAKSLGWQFGYGMMAILMGIGVAAVFCAPREAEHVIRPIHFEGMKPNPVLEGVEWASRAMVVVIAALLMGSGLSGSTDLLNPFLGVIGIGPEGQTALKEAFTAKTTGVFYQLPAVLMGLGLFIASCLPLPWATRPGVYFKGTFIEPMADFFKRYEDWAAFIFALICFYRISEFALSIMNPFYLDLGFALDTVGEMRKGFGVVMLMVGVGIAGWVTARFGLKRALIIGAVAGPFSHVGFMALAAAGDNLLALGVALALDNIAASIAGTVLIAYMSTLTSKAYTASQYAIFSSFYAILGKLVASQSGRIVEGAAKGADAGDINSLFKGLMHHLPAHSYAKAAAKLGVSVEAMGAGYFAFFAYTIILGLLPLALAVWLVVRRKDKPAAAEPETV